MTRIYLKTYAALLALLAATVGAYFINLGAFNAAAALIIALAKAALVLVFFMHIRAASRAAWLYAVLGLLWISFLVGGTLADVLTR
jgi:cytochrome c oxidase subunit 4